MSELIVVNSQLTYSTADHEINNFTLRSEYETRFGSSVLVPGGVYRIVNGQVQRIIGLENQEINPTRNETDNS